MDEAIKQKIVRVGILAAAVLVLILLLISYGGGAFSFLGSKNGVHSDSLVASTNIAFYSPEAEDFTNPDSLDHFFHDPAKPELKVSGSCSDAYYAILLFPPDVDYRVNPGAARYNRAFTCPGESFSAALNLAEANLPKGEYYLVIADQGVSGSWYNPR